METGPSAIAEAVVAALLPADRRDDVLGDLHQRHIGPSGYWRDACQIVPVIIFGHMQRESRRHALMLSHLCSRRAGAVKSSLFAALAYADTGLTAIALTTWMATHPWRWPALGAMLKVWMVTMAAAHIAFRRDTLTPER